MRQILFLCLLIISLLMSSCNNEIEINGEWKETMIVYGILDPSQQDQYIKINRAFLGEGNALLFAQIPDSSIYPYLLDVVLEELNSSNQVVRTFYFDTVHIYKEGGVFYSGYQPIYHTRIANPSYIDPLRDDTFWLSEDYTYRLRIVNPVTGNIVESTTPIVHNFTIKKPVPGATQISFATANTVNAEWTSATNGRLYDLTFRFHFQEVYFSSQNDTINRSVDWKIGSVKSSKLDGTESMTVSYYNPNFFQNLGNRILAADTIQRYPGKVELIFAVGADELSTYIDVNGPNTGIIQERPQYTNISNGIGIFSSRFYKSFYYKLNAYSIDSLKNGVFTIDLNFNDYPIP